MPDPQPVTANDLSRPEFLAWYGPWQPLTMPQISELLAGSGVRWWIAGGYAIDAATGTTREHEDVDLAIAACDLPRFRQWLPQLRLWEAHDGALAPLFPGNTLREGREQVWARRDAASPWLMDVLLTPTDNGDWLFKRDRTIRMRLDEAIIHHHKVPFLAPQCVLLYKARSMRDKDVRDFRTALPHLDAAARDWLAAALEHHLPDHPWHAELR